MLVLCTLSFVAGEQWTSGQELQAMVEESQSCTSRVSILAGSSLRGPLFKRTIVQSDVQLQFTEKKEKAIAWVFARLYTFYGYFLYLSSHSIYPNAKGWCEVRGAGFPFPQSETFS